MFCHDIAILGDSGVADMTTGFLGLRQQKTIARDEFEWWPGRSGCRWITTVHPLFHNFSAQPAVYLMVRRDTDGSRYPLYIGQTENLRRRMMEHTKDKLMRAYRLGANELHAHYIAEREGDRITIETDLRNAHATPINEQATSALGGLFGLGKLYPQPPQRSWLNQLGLNR